MTGLPELDQTSVATVHDIRSLVYTVPEIAVLLMISRHTAYAMVRNGQIPARQLGTRWVIPREVSTPGSTPPRSRPRPHQPEHWEENDGLHPQDPGRHLASMLARRCRP